MAFIVHFCLYFETNFIFLVTDLSVYLVEVYFSTPRGYTDSSLRPSSFPLTNRLYFISLLYTLDFYSLFSILYSYILHSIHPK